MDTQDWLAQLRMHIISSAGQPANLYLNMNDVVVLDNISEQLSTTEQALTQATAEKAVLREALEHISVGMSAPTPTHEVKWARELAEAALTDTDAAAQELLDKAAKYDAAVHFPWSEDYERLRGLEKRVETEVTALQKKAKALFKDNIMDAAYDYQRQADHLFYTFLDDGDDKRQEAYRDAGI